MLLFIILLATDILSFLVLKEHLYRSSGTGFIVASIIHLVLSIWLWITYISVISWKGSFDTPQNVDNQMKLTGLISAVVATRGLIIITHYLGKLFRIKEKSYIRSLTNLGLISASFYFTILAISFITKFNYKTEEITISIKDLPEEFDGLRVVHISDLHLGGFNSRPEKVNELVELINGLNPDIIINSGDFVSYGWRELAGFDTVLAKARSRYGNFAILGNHDIGTYIPEQTEEGIDENLTKMRELIKSSGYVLLENKYSEIKIGTKKLSVIGVSTGGRFPDITHGSIVNATSGMGSSDLLIAICHDPDQWEKEIVGKTNIHLTLSGHTHAMQMGIHTPYFKWSAAKYIYSNWNGIYVEGDQYQYVNRGAGVLIPFRIWMPPEITVINLKSGDM